MMKDGHRNLKQVTIYNSMVDVFKKDALDSVDASLPEIRKIIFERDFNGMDITMLVVGKSIEYSIGLASKYQEKNNRNVVVYLPSLSDKVRNTLKSYGSNVMRILLAEYDVLFDEFMLGRKYIQEIYDKVLFQENKNILESMEKNSRKFDKAQNALANNGGRVGNNSKSHTGGLTNLLGIMLSGLTEGNPEVNGYVRDKIIAIGEVLYNNGYPDYRNLVLEKFSPEAYEDHKRKLAENFPDVNGSANQSLFVGKENTDKSTFQIKDYSKFDPSLEANKVQAYEGLVRMLQDVLEEADYRITDNTQKIINRLERAALSIPSLKSEVLSKDSTTKVFNYLVNDIFEIAKVKSLMEKIVMEKNSCFGRGEETTDTVFNDYMKKEIESVVFDLVRYYNAEKSHRKGIESVLKESVEKLNTAEHFQSVLQKQKKRD